MAERFMEHWDAAIAGGGMVGMSMALALARVGLRVMLIEKASMPAQLESSFDGRVSAVAYGSKRILEAVGAWDAMAPYAEPILDIRVSDGAAPVFLHYDHREIGEMPFGYIIENRYIRHGLQKAARRLAPLVIREEMSVQAFAPDDAGMTLHLSNGETHRCRLLIGADGKASPLRAQAGIGAVEWNYRQTAIVCTIRHTLPHEGLAQERFLPAGPFAVLPMTQGRSSLVWVEPQDRAPLYLSLPEDEFVQEIRERIGEYLGDLTTEGGRFSYPLSLMHAKTYIGPRLALIGDAAHAIHPIAGQGVNLGFRDVAALSELIVERARLGLDIGGGDVLAHYQRWRRFDNVTMLAVTDGLNRLFTNSLLPVQLARRLGLWAVERVPPVKRYFMRHAMGLSSDIPKISG